MKILLIILFVFSGSFAYGDNFRCDANSEKNLAGYKVYVSGVSDGQVREVDGGKADLVFKPSGTDEEKWSMDMREGNWYMKVTAFDTSGNESLFSKEINNVIPKAPENVMRVIVKVDVMVEQ